MNTRKTTIDPQAGPPHSRERREPLPWQQPKPIEEDPDALARIHAILASPNYRLAEDDPDFLDRNDLRGVRLQMDYLKAELLLAENHVEHTIVVFGGTRICEPAEARRRVASLRAALAADAGDAELAQRLAIAERVLAKSHYYDVARDFGRLVSEANRGRGKDQVVIMTGGGPGIMEAANRGAFDAGAKSVGLNISLPHEQYPNPYVTTELCFNFHYFALRKLHFLLRARALIAFPGGYGTFDELFEVLTLVQTRKIKPIPVVLVGESFWRRAVDIGLSCRGRRHRPRRPRALLVCRNGGRDLGRHPALAWRQRRAALSRGVICIAPARTVPRHRSLVQATKPTEEVDMKLSFHGADRDVTGSCHLVECAGRRILIDCGLYQGSHELDEDNAGPFGFDAAAIDIVLLTHAHLDHCGRLPLLVKRGFRGEIITTAASRELARLVLLDSAHLQEEDFRRRGKFARRGGKKPDAEPLYSMIDALGTFDAFGRVAEYGKPIDLADGVRATFLDAGHILGSASVFLELSEGDRQRRVLFSGDLGNGGRPILRDPARPPQSDAVVMESTYGDRLHKPLPPSVAELYQAIGEAFSRGGNVIIPTFALERAQELLYYLREGIEKNALSPSIQVFLDSPMAISATEIFRRHPECFDAEAMALFSKGHDPFALPGLHFVRETADSIALNRITGGAVIMAGSGMATGGRVRHHLKHNLWRHDSSVIFVGFAAKGTLARQIIDGAKEVSIFGERIPVKAHIHTINGFSAHADQAELLAWQKETHAARTFLVHGEETTMQSFAAKLTDTQVEMPTVGQTFEL